MRTLAKIIKDNNDELYLKVYDKASEILAYFKIQPWNTKPDGRIEELSYVFSVDLSGNNESKDNSKKRKLSKTEFKNLSKRANQEY